ncbi:MAG TPA: EAL domain-containing protein [Gemmatimonadales bacterium]|nr:EAL domain-containing protein [Gemmatimonadales bacterium]
MTLASAPLQSRFGRRLLLLFVGCALLPIGIVAAVSYRHVTGELRKQSEHRLHQANKALGLAVYERLLLLDATLRSIPPRVLRQLGSDARPAEADRLLAAGLDLLASRRFVALEFVGDDGSRHSVFGRLEERPVLSAEDRDNLRLGLPVIVNAHGDARAPRTFMLRRIERREVRGTLFGQVSPDFLWTSLASGMPSPTTVVSVVDDSGHVLFRSTQAELVAQSDPINEAAPLAADPRPVPVVADRPFVTSSWPLVLDEVFAAPAWTLVLSENEEEVLGPVFRFSRTFILVVGLSGVAVLLLSVTQIRRSLVPLVELSEGTRRIARHDFAGRVSVASKDEFEELAGAFNTMATQLGRQFQALSTAAELDRAVLSARDAASIVDTLLARTRDVYPCHLVGVTLVSPENGKSLSGVVYDYCDDIRHTARVEIRSEDVQDLLDGPDLALFDAAEEGLPAYLEPLLRHGPRSVLVLPLRFRRQLVGIFAIAGRTASEASPDEQLQVRRLADQAAVGLVNAQMLEQVKSLAYYDSLTGLPNRLSYKERLAKALEHARRSGKLVAAFFIDLDHFSRINDTLGHEAGDQLLQQVALRLRGSCRDREDEVGSAQDALTPDVARLGGDEFTVIIPGLSRSDDAGKLARRILSGFAHPFRVANQEIFVNASIGIAIYPEDGEDMETLLMHADTAMYKAKEQGGSSYQAYSRAMNASALQRLTLENALRRALDRSEFELHYQPIVDGGTGQVTGAEALVRWRHPELGLLLPAEFIPLAEENGLIVPLGEWVLHEACTQNRAWQTAGLAPLRVVVNLSSRQLRRNLPETVARILQSTGLDARFLGLELTESLLVAHHKEDTDTLHALRAMGLHLAVDDFGTGYSSFSYLKHLPLDALKIDRSFVREVNSSPDDAAITTAIIAMAHALGLKVVGEGVETAAQRDVLRRQGCDAMQGYLFSRPVPAAEFERLLARPPRPARPVRRLKSA